jgi:hypothetical protein
MSARIKLVTLALAAFAGVAVSTAAQAEGQQFHLLGGAFDTIVNEALAADRAYYGTGDPRCPLVRTYDGYGNLSGHVHTCRLPPTWSNGILQLRSPRLQLRQAAPKASIRRPSVSSVYASGSARLDAATPRAE